MKHWPLIVVILYGLFLLLLTVPLILILFYPLSEVLDLTPGELEIELLKGWSYWLWIAVALTAQVLLLRVPVYITQGRVIKKSKISLSIFASAFMMAGLVAGAFIAASETLIQDALYEPMWWASLAVLFLSWILWARIFRRWSLGLEPRGLIEKQCRSLFRGSILELLIAVPAHILARHRDYCCAGFGTFIGIAAGLSVMIFSFGPSVFFLYALRWKRLKPSRSKENPKEKNGK